MSGEHRADLIFALPVVPRRAVLAGDLPGWEQGLLARGVEVVTAADGDQADLVVATADRGCALRLGQQGIIEGVRRVASEWRRRGHTRRLISIPPSGDPQATFDLGNRRATRYGLSRAVTPPEWTRRARNEVAARLSRAGLLPPLQHLAVTVSPHGDEPALLGPLRQIGLTGSEWYTVHALGSVVRRNAAFVFDGGSAPRYVVKYSRVPGLSVQFDRDESGLRIAAQHAVTAARAPTLLGRLELPGGYSLSVETAVVGSSLACVLRRSRHRRDRLRAVEAGASWIRDVGQRTATAPGAVRMHVERLTREAAPRHSLALSRDAVEAVGSLPAVVIHGDVHEEHIITAGDGFTVIDWEYAASAGLPLGDLLFYAANVLAAVDDPKRTRPRSSYVADLFAGRAPSSPTAMRWIREYVAALHLPAAAVGPAATLYWLSRSELSRVERERAERETGDQLAQSWLEQTIGAWLADEALGPQWSVWSVT